MSHFYRVMLFYVDNFLHFNVFLKQLNNVECAFFRLFDADRAHLFHVCQAL